MALLDSSPADPGEEQRRVKAAAPHTLG